MGDHDLDISPFPENNDSEEWRYSNTEMSILFQIRNYEKEAEEE